MPDDVFIPYTGAQFIQVDGYCYGLHEVVSGPYDAATLQGEYDDCTDCEADGGLSLWTPARISVRAWYDSSDLDTITETGGYVSQWDDKSGNDKHLIQDLGANQPRSGVRQLNNLNVIDGDGSQSMYHDNYPAGGGTGDVQVIAVCGVDSVSYFSDGIFAMAAPAGSDFKFSAGDPTDVSGDFNGFIQGGFGPNIIMSGGPHAGPSIYNAEFDRTIDGAVVGRVDGVNYGSSAYTSDLASPTQLAVLSDKNQVNSIDGLIAELIIVNDTSSDTRYRLEGYLAWKWGLQANLPPGHPYELGAPTNA